MKAAEAVIAALKSTHVISSKLITDNMLFKSEKFKHFAGTLKSLHSVQHIPQLNGLTECYVHTFNH